MEFKEPKILFSAIRRGVNVGYDEADKYARANGLNLDRWIIESSIVVEILKCIDEIS
jgi:hypothetical protein